MRVVGLDIGTTTLSATVLDSESGSVLASRTISHASMLPGPEWAMLQDPACIRELSIGLVEELCREYSPISAIGFTGQMHGIVYLDSVGEPVSPLYTWQDERCNLKTECGETYAERLTRITGQPVATGYGLATHYYNQLNGLVPGEARKIATIADCVGMWLTGEREPILHASNAASMGLFDIARVAFDEDALCLAGIDREILPRVAFDAVPIGNTRTGTTVSIAIGDNQASFAGSVRTGELGVLVNVGTGGQISVGTPSPIIAEGCETRPGVEGGYLIVGSSLCGGRAYALLEDFFRETAVWMGAPDRNQYEWMNRAAAEALTCKDPLIVDTAFSGTRQNPCKRGSIANLSLTNFTPGSLCAGILSGIVEELHAYYRAILSVADGTPRKLVGSGNGIRLNPVLRSLFAETFGMPLVIPEHHEEAAYGAALCACVASGQYSDIASAQTLIHYV
jgi:sedoheptulokinase